VWAVVKWWRVGWSGAAHARCFNGLMSIYGLSSELTARRAVYMFCTNVHPRPQMSNNPHVQGSRRDTDPMSELHTRGRKCPGTNRGFYTTVNHDVCCYTAALQEMLVRRTGNTITYYCHYHYYYCTIMFLC